MGRIRLSGVAALVALGMASACQAQIVRWDGFGGVRVRAPFVKVDVAPNGDTWVRAPFTNVYSPGPGFRYGPFPPVPPVGVVPVIPALPVPAYPVPAYPVPAVPGVVQEVPSIPVEGYQVTRPSIDGHVAEDLHRAAIRLQSNLSRRQDGDVWLEYLNPARIITSIQRGDPPGSLRDLITNYDGVVANTSLRSIYTIDGFDETRELLRVYVDLPSKGATVASPPATLETPGSGANDVSNGVTDHEELPRPKPDSNGNGSNRPTPPPPAPHPPSGPTDEPADI